ncbi:MAG: polyprenyl synthetase family protein [Myxococcota bacterium]
MQGHSSTQAVVTITPTTSPLDSLSVVSRRSGLDALASRLGELQRLLADDLGELEVGLCQIHQQAQNDELDLAKRAAHHLLARPGKRIRSLCVILGARLGGRLLDDDVRNLAIACELVHAATLLHDDVIDEGTQRRGAPASRMVFGNSASILAGDHLLVEALRLVEAAGPAWLLTQLLGVISKMVAAEALQLERRGRFDPSPDTYLEVIRGKSAALFRWGLQAGAVVAKMPENHVELLGEVGLALGMAFQLVDDVLDLRGDADVTGKNTLVDLREGKLTWPLIIAAQRHTALCAQLQNIAIGQHDLTDERAQYVMEEVCACGALDTTCEFAQAQADHARTLLTQLPITPARRAMEIVIDSAVNRIL